MKVLFALTYYVLHLSGLTIYVQHLAEGLAARGYHTTLLTSRYDKSLPARASKGVLMPTIGGMAIRRKQWRCCAGWKWITSTWAKWSATLTHIKDWRSSTCCLVVI